MAVVINGNGAVTGLTALPDSAMAEGSIIQVVSTFKGDVFSTTSTSLTDITGFALTITPSSNSSKILIISTCGWSNNTNTDAVSGFQLVKVVGGTASNIAEPDTSTTHGTTAVQSNPNGNTGFSQQRWHYTFLDSPATTSAVTYKWQSKVFSSGTTLHINRRAFDSSGGTTNDMQTTATITAMEVSA
tara:strand:+ start:357 stop:917 length:561 start_codon:yes stop_codon:yes gene_type:complete